MKESDLSSVEKQPKFSYGYNLNDRPDNYQGQHRSGNRAPGQETSLNIASERPVVYLGVESIEGLGDSVVIASMSFREAVKALQGFSSRIDGQEIFPERMYLPDAGSVRMRRADNTSTRYRVDPMPLTS